MTKKIVPEVRFKKDQVDWKSSEFGKEIDVSSASRVHKNEWTESGVPFYRTSDVVSDFYGTENRKAFISLKRYEELAKRSGCLQKNDLLVTGGGSIGIPFLVKNNDPLYFKDADLLWFKNKDKLDGYFVFTFFSTSIFREYLKSISHSGTISHYTIEQAKATPIRLPETKIQRLLGEHFSLVDRLITLRSKKFEKLLNVKKAMLEKMFPIDGADVPEIRFRGFTRKWEQKDLSDEVDFFSGLTYSPLDVVKEDGTLVLRSSNVQDGELSLNDHVYVRSDVASSSNVLVGDIIVVVRNGSRNLIGKHAQIKQEMKNTVIGAFMTGIRPRQSSFINALLDTNLFSKEVEKNLGATINQITTGMFNKMRFLFPEEEEQKAIGLYFDNLNKLIVLQREELEKLKNIKKAMLDKMFV